MSLTMEDVATIESWDAPIEIRCSRPADGVSCLICPLYMRCPKVRAWWKAWRDGIIRKAMEMGG